MTSAPELIDFLISCTRLPERFAELALEAGFTAFFFVTLEAGLPRLVADDDDDDDVFFAGETAFFFGVAAFFLTGAALGFAVVVARFLAVLALAGAFLVGAALAGAFLVVVALAGAFFFAGDLAFFVTAVTTFFASFAAVTVAVLAAREGWRRVVGAVFGLLTAIVALLPVVS